MKIYRRQFLSTGAAVAASSLIPNRVWASNSLALGSAKLTTLSDGYLSLPADFAFSDMPADQIAALRREFNLPQDRYEPPCNVTLLQDGQRNILFDVGAGHDFMPGAGKLAEPLAALGLGVEDISHVVFTHGHPDHLWGLLDAFDDPLFTNAEFMMGQTEFAYWTDPDTVATINPERTAFAVGAARRLAIIADQITLFDDAAELLPGVISRATPGHTPGHMSFILHGGAEAALVAGDAISNPHVAFAKPLYGSPSDQDPATAATTRAALLDQITAEKMHLIGFHLPQGGIGRAERWGDAYRYTER